jgi:protein-S-isoprenylcysteine O-methyltransferase Ste14
MSNINLRDAALWLYLLYFALAFALRSVIQLRRTGSTGFRGISGRPGSTEWIGGVLFIASLALGLAACALARAGVIAPAPPLDRADVRAAGLVLFAAGTAATLGSQFAMGSSWRIGVDEKERTKLVTSGPFRLVRNPIFSAMMLTAIGLALMIPNAAAIGAVVLLVIAVEIQVRLVEEPYLLKAHGADYAAYAARTGRFVPLFGRLTHQNRR